MIETSFKSFITKFRTAARSIGFSSLTYWQNRPYRPESRPSTFGHFAPMSVTEADFALPRKRTL
jgi:hypothetical protein